MEGLGFDLRTAIRSILRYPAFSAAVVATLALGIGANAGLFTLAYPLVLRPLPYAEPERLVAVSETVRRDSVERRPFSYPNFLDLEASASSFSGLAGWSDIGVSLTGLVPAERLPGELVTPEYFRVLGVEPALGRSFLPEEGDPEGGAQAVVLGSGLARRLFPERRDPLGASVEIAGQPATVVGVMPDGFVGLSQEAELWIPVRSVPEAEMERGDRWLAVVGRLAPGASLARAGEEAVRIAARLEAEHPDSNRLYGSLVLGLREELVGGLSRSVMLLFGAVAFVLLIACANVANLLLIRSTVRRREGALRRALGMSAARRLRLHLAEALLLSLGGTGLGLLLATWGLEGFAALNPVPLPPFVRLELNLPVVAFALLLALASAGALAGVELLQGGGRSLAEGLREGGRGGDGGARSHRLRRALVIAEVALALVLAIGAGLMVQSLSRLARIDPGLSREGVLTARVVLPPGRPDAEAPQLASELLERLRALPGVEAAALSSDTPFGGQASATLLQGEGWEPRAGEPYDGLTRVYGHRATPGFLGTLGIALVAGRDFTSLDATGSERVAIVSETLGRRLWPGEDAMGKRFRFGRSSDSPWNTVVGVARDVRYRSLAVGPDWPEDPDLYVPLLARAGMGLAISLRTGLDPASLVGPLRSEVHRLAREMPVFEVEVLDRQIAEQLGQPRLTTSLLGLFAVLAALLAAVGIYSVLAFLVGQRTREIGVRIALGADRGSVLGLVARQGMGLVTGGLVLGLALALVLTRFLAAQLHGVSATDPLSFALTALALAGLALAACLLPARRAARVDPAVSLRAE